MKLDKETIIAISVCMVLLLAWPVISAKMGWTKPAENEAVATESVADKTDNSAVAEKTPAAAVSELAQTAEKAEKTSPAQPAPKVEIPEIPQAEPVDFNNKKLALTVCGKTGTVEKIRFLNYKHNNQESDITIDGASLFALNIPALKDAKPVTVISENGDTVTVSCHYQASGINVTRTYSFKDDYIVNCRISVKNSGSEPVSLSDMTLSSASIAPWHTLSGDKLRTMSHRLDILTTDGDREDVDGDEDDEDYFFEEPQHVRWASVSNKYFCSVLKPESAESFRLWQENPRRQVTDNKDKKFNVLAVGAVLPEAKLMPQESKDFEYSVYIGPKSAGVLAEFAEDADSVMHMAWGPINYLAKFLMWVLNLLYAICHSYGVSIIILTLLVRTAFYPLTSKGNESMRKMQKVQPMFKELKEKYKDNPQLLNQKMTELYRKEGINPLAGCFPILLQIPIFFALYAMLDNAIALRHVSFLWAKNLAAADTIFSIPLGFTLPFFNVDAIPVNPLVLAMTALMMVQQRMTPMSADPAQKRMMQMMPVIMLIFLYDLPSGLTLYWTVSNIFSIIQLWLQQKRNRAQQAAADGQSK